MQKAHFFLFTGMGLILLFVPFLNRIIRQVGNLNSVWESPCERKIKLDHNKGGRYIQINLNPRRYIQINLNPRSFKNKIVIRHNGTLVHSNHQ